MLLSGCATSAFRSEPTTVGAHQSDSLQLPLINGLLGMEDGQRAVLHKAEEHLLSKCLAAMGFSYITFPQDPSSTTFSMIELYGSISVDNAQKFGYHNPRAAELVEIDRLYAISVARVSSQGEDSYLAGLSSCTSTATKELYGAESRPSDSKEGVALVALSAKAQEQVGTDKRFGVISDLWVGCMNKAGYQFKAMSDGRARFQFAPDDITEPTRDELRTAAADADCRREVGVDAFIASRYSEALTKQLEDNPGLATDLQSQLRSALSRAGAILRVS
jgi:hypothetical protein